MLPEYLIHLQHHRIGRQLALRLCICGMCLPRVPAALAPLVAKLFRVPQRDLAT